MLVEGLSGVGGKSLLLQEIAYGVTGRKEVTDYKNL